LKKIYEDEANQEGVLRCERRILSFREAIYSQTRDLGDKAKILESLTGLIDLSEEMQAMEMLRRYQKKADALKKPLFHAFKGGKWISKK